MLLLLLYVGTFEIRTGLATLLLVVLEIIGLCAFVEDIPNCGEWYLDLNSYRVSSITGFCLDLWSKYSAGIGLPSFTCTSTAVNYLPLIFQSWFVATNSLSFGMCVSLLYIVEMDYNDLCLLWTQWSHIGWDPRLSHRSVEHTGPANLLRLANLTAVKGGDKWLIILLISP